MNVVSLTTYVVDAMRKAGVLFIPTDLGIGPWSEPVMVGKPYVHVHVDSEWDWRSGHESVWVTDREYWTTYERTTQFVAIGTFENRYGYEERFLVEGTLTETDVQHDSDYGVDEWDAHALTYVAHAIRLRTECRWGRSEFILPLLKSMDITYGSDCNEHMVLKTVGSKQGYCIRCRQVI